MNPMRLLFVGVGGYGGGYMRELLAHPERDDVKLVGVVDPYVSASSFEQTLKEMCVPVYETVEAFFAQNQADLTVISTPIQFHAAQSIYAMQSGSHVLVEKPIAATMRDAKEMARVRDETHRVLAVGFQWCYDAAMLRLKRDIEQGMLGAPRSLRAMVLWPRDIAYYKRGLGWAGKRYDAQGRPILDNIAANATAHYLENMLWLAGGNAPDDLLVSVTAETARVNDIEMYDTIVARFCMKHGAHLFFVASHATGRNGVQEPMLEYRFEKAVVRFGGLCESGSALTAAFSDHIEDYGVSYPNGCGMIKLWTVIDAIRTGGSVPCPAELAMRHTAAMELINAHLDVKRLDNARLDEGMMWSPGLYERLVRCYQEEKLPSEIDR